MQQRFASVRKVGLMCMCGRVGVSECDGPACRRVVAGRREEWGGGVDRVPPFGACGAGPRCRELAAQVLDVVAEGRLLLMSLGGCLKNVIDSAAANPELRRDRRQLHVLHTELMRMLEAPLCLKCGGGAELSCAVAGCPMSLLCHACHAAVHVGADGTRRRRWRCRWRCRACSCSSNSSDFAVSPCGAPCCNAAGLPWVA